MGEPVRELAVVRQEEDAGRVAVEPPDRHDPDVAADEVDDGRPPFGSRAVVIVAARLVEQDVAQLLLPDRATVDATTSAPPTNVFSSPGAPLTVTRPALISSSAPRREATPARAR